MNWQKPKKQGLSSKEAETLCEYTKFDLDYLFSTEGVASQKIGMGDT